MNVLGFEEFMTLALLLCLVVSLLVGAFLLLFKISELLEKIELHLAKIAMTVNTGRSYESARMVVEVEKFD